MPAKVHRNVQRKVHRALFLASLEHLLDQADAYLETDSLLEGEGFINAPKAAFWTVVRNAGGKSYVRALIRFTDGSEITRAWLVPRNGVGLSKDVCGLIWTKYVPLDKWDRLLYPDRARGWAVVARGGATKRSTRTRPAVGRAFKRRS
jgi:hypothetical protein